MNENSGGVVKKKDRVLYSQPISFLLAYINAYTLGFVPVSLLPNSEVPVRQISSTQFCHLSQKT